MAPLLLVVAGAFGGRRVAMWIVIETISWLLDIYASIVFGVAAAVLERECRDFHRRTWVRASLLAVALSLSPMMVGGVAYERIAPVFAISVVLLLAVPGSPSRLGRFVGGIHIRSA